MKKLLLWQLIGLLPLAQVGPGGCFPAPPKPGDEDDDPVSATCPLYADPVIPLDGDTPLAPSDLSLTPVLGGIGGSNKLAWTDNSHNEDGFKIWRKGLNADWAIIDTVEADHPYYHDFDAYGDLYSYRVQAFNAFPSSMSNIAGAEATVSPTPTLPAPSNLTATPGDDHVSISLRWTNNALKVTCFEVERVTDRLGGPNVGGWEYAFRRIGIAEDTCFVDREVDPAQHSDLPYVYRVRAYYGPPSNPMNPLRSAYSGIATAVPDPQGLVAPRIEIDILGSGHGQVAGQGIECSSRYCTALYSPGDTAILTPVPALGSTFDGWSGCDTVDGETCLVRMDSSREVQVKFIEISPPEVVLSGPSEATAWYTLRWTVNWPEDAVADDYCELQYSEDGVTWFGWDGNRFYDKEPEYWYMAIAAEEGEVTDWRVVLHLGEDTLLSNVVRTTCPYLRRPSLNGPLGQVTEAYSLSWSFDWPERPAEDVESVEFYVLESSSAPFVSEESNPDHIAFYDKGSIGATLNPIPGQTTYHRVSAQYDEYFWTPWSNVVSVYCPALTDSNSVVYYTTHDNLLMASSLGTDEANTVYQYSENAVGANWVYPDLYGYSYLVAATALRFDGIETVIAGRSIQCAILRLAPYGDVPMTGTTYVVNPMGQAWDPSALTYATTPNFHTNLEAVAPGPWDADLNLVVSWDIDITPIVQAWANGLPNYGLLLRDKYASDAYAPGLTSFRMLTAYSNDNAALQAQRPHIHLVLY
jgi:hypothetical protein